MIPSINYRMPVAAGGLQVVQADLHVPVWGRSAHLQFSGFVSQNMGTCINFGMRPSKDVDRAAGAAIKGVLLARDGRRMVEQHIQLPQVAGQIMGFHNLTDADATVGEALATDLHDRLEMAYERCRRGIRDGFGGAARDLSVRAVQQLWERYTLETTNFLRHIAFTILMRGCGAKDEFFTALFRAFDARPLRINPIGMPDGDSEIQPWSENPFGLKDAVDAYYAEQERLAMEAQRAAWEKERAEREARYAAELERARLEREQWEREHPEEVARQRAERAEQERRAREVRERHERDRMMRAEGYAAIDANKEARLAFLGAKNPNGRALELLNLVCGAGMAQEYLNSGHITVRKNDYTFEVAPGHGQIECTDPAGKRARLCITSLGDCVNPIDEVTIAFMNISHNFAEWFAKANVMPHDRDFAIPQEARDWRHGKGKRRRVA